LKECSLKNKSRRLKRKNRQKNRTASVVRSRGKPRIVVECNFYNTTGSKSIETANAYIDFQRKIRESGGCSFVWITDGPAWDKMRKTVVQCFGEIDFPINYTIADEKLEEIFRELLKHE
jgi:type II restriction enzyme